MPKFTEIFITRSLLLASASFVALSTYQPAAALTVNSVGTPTAGTAGSDCQIVVDLNATGTTGDFFTVDYFHVGLVYSTGAQIPDTPQSAWNSISRLVGQTGNSQAFLNSNVLTTGQVTNIVGINIYEATGATLADRGAILQQIPISTAILSAVPACAHLIPNQAPTVNAGPDQTVSELSTVTMNASANDFEGDPLTFSWTQSSGPVVSLSNPTALNPSFSAPVKTSAIQTLTFDLTANDGFATSAADQVAIMVSANFDPVAGLNAIGQVVGGSTVLLDGTSSTDADSDTLSYAWTQINGPAVTIANANSAIASFVAPPRTTNNQVLEFELNIDDGFGGFDSIQVTAIVPSNGVPVADAGTDQTVSGNSNVTLSGVASSDLENDPLTYAWTQTSGPTVVLAGASTATPSFTAPTKTGATQTLSFELIVDDGIDPSSADSVDVLISANVDPVSDAGTDISTPGGALVTLDSSASADGDGDTLTYAWSQTGGPAVTLSDATVANPTFTAPLGALTAQTLTFDLVVNDGFVSAPADQIVVSISPNSPPVANAGADQAPINSGDVVTLTGAGSSDPDGNVLTYSWSQVSGTPVTLSSATVINPSFTAPLVNANENLVFQLVVNDGVVDSPADTVTISVQAVGTIRIIQQIIGADVSVTYSSDVAALTGSIATLNGTGELTASSVPAGAHTVSASDLTPQGYTLTGITCSDGDSIVDVASRSVAIVLSPTEDLTCTFTSTNTRDAATRAIRDFLTGRNGLILANQPDAQRRLVRLQGQAPSAGSVSVAGFGIPGAGALPMNLSMGAGQGQFSTSLSQVRAAFGASTGADPDRGELPFDIWGELNFGSAEFGGDDYDYQIAYIGADYLASDTLLVGLLGQYDKLDRSGSIRAGSAEGDGWMVGPYVTTKLSEHIYGDVRIAWGKSNNTVSPLGTFSDAFDTNRSLYTGSLVGVFDVNARTSFRPEISLRYMKEEQDSYRDSFGIMIPSQSVGQGNIAFSPRIDRTIDMDNGWTLKPYASVDGIYTFGAADESPLEDSLRARVELGGQLYRSGLFGINLSANFDGIGAANYQSSGVMVSLSRGF